MRVWTNEHIYKEPWEHVVQAASRKYPNPINSHVIGVDIVDRKIDSRGILCSHKLLTTLFTLPSVVKKVVDCDKKSYVSEHSTIDPTSRILKMHSRNLTLQNWLKVDEKMEYRPHPENPKEMTMMKHYTTVEVSGFSFMNGTLEDMIKNSLADKAAKGIEGINWVINNVIKTEDNVLNKSKPSTAL